MYKSLLQIIILLGVRSCIYLHIVFGCIDPLACNYDSLQIPNGSCFLDGCTDSTAFNYNLAYVIDLYPFIFGCINPLACNFDSTANMDDGSCLLFLVVQIHCFNFNPLAECDDSLHCYFFGCRILACNYNCLQIDDSSCLTFWVFGFVSL